MNRLATAASKPPARKAFAHWLWRFFWRWAASMGRAIAVTSQMRRDRLDLRPRAGLLSRSLDYELTPTRPFEVGSAPRASACMRRTSRPLATLRS
jgi:hypothetical protein